MLLKGTSTVVRRDVLELALEIAEAAKKAQIDSKAVRRCSSRVHLLLYRMCWSYVALLIAEAAKKAQIDSK